VPVQEWLGDQQEKLRLPIVQWSQAKRDWAFTPRLSGQETYLMPRTILVTGSTSGFGRLTVETLLRQGYIVFAGMRAVTGKNANAAEALRGLAQHEELALHIVEIDITDEASVNQAIETVVGTTGRVDVVVNNAGVSYSGPLEAFSLEQVQHQFATNVFGAWLVNRAALPHMRRQGSGLLLHIGSIAGRITVPFLGLYGATKFALEALTEAYRYELAPFGIDVAIIEPGTFPTPIGANSQLAADSERVALYQRTLDAFYTKFFAENRSSTPPEPQDVADAVASVIAQPAGERPPHTVVASVAQRQAPQAVNDAVARATRSFYESLQLPEAQWASEREEVARST